MNNIHKNREEKKVEEPVMNKNETKIIYETNQSIILYRRSKSMNENVSFKNKNKKKTLREKPK